MPSNPSASNLSLWKKRLGQVPEWVWERTDLETLVLADNDLSEVSPQIGRLKALRMLDLGHNALTEVPDALGDLDGLTDFLYLHDNRLTSLPTSLAKLKKLRYLNISGNALKVLPDCIFAMSGLIELRALRPLKTRAREETEGRLVEMIQPLSARSTRVYPLSNCPAGRA